MPTTARNDNSADSHLPDDRGPRPEVSPLFLPRRGFSYHAVTALCLVTMFLGGMLAQALLHRPELKRTRELYREMTVLNANILLREEGYRMYFVSHENGDLALVYPAFKRKNIPTGEEGDEGEQ